MAPMVDAPVLSLAEVRWAVQQACRAPSIHNSQPWSFRWHPATSTLDVCADTKRGLTASDPDGRELVLSCGAAVTNLQVALRKLGLRGSVTPLPVASQPRLLARVTVTEASPADAAERRHYAALVRRHSRRTGFADRPLTPQDAVELQRAAEAEGAQLVFLHDPGQRRRVLSLAGDARRTLAADERVQAEVDRWTPAPASRRRDGVPAIAYSADPVVADDALPQRDFDRGRGIGMAVAGEAAPGSVAVLTTERDVQVDWLQAGQALERVLLTAAEHWVFAALDSQLVEVPPLRAELRRELRITGYPQMVLRLGYASDAQTTPRRAVAEVLTVVDE
jgi:hypothetical protein